MAQTREREIEKVKQQLLWSSMPRFHISVILLFTGIAGFLTSFSLLRLGVSAMSVRYPIAILIGYCVFLLLLRLWLWLQRRSLDVNFDLPDFNLGSSGTSSHAEGFEFGGGGDFGGGGAGGSWGNSVSSSSNVSSGGSSFDGGGFDLDLGELGLVILAAIALIGGLVASLYIIYIAPALLAEILLDGVLVASLYKRVKGIERKHWLRAAVRRTIMPAILAAIFFTVAGFAMQRAVPTARSIGEVWHHLMES